MTERLGLRLRFALFFAAIGLGGTALFALALWFGWQRSGAGANGFVAAGVLGAFGLIGLVAWVGYLFDENVARPILHVASDLQARANTDIPAEVDGGQARYLGSLAPAARAIHHALDHARREHARSVKMQTAQLAYEKALLEALVRDLSEPIVIASSTGRVILYNAAAQTVLGDIGVDRSLDRFLRLDPVMAAAAQLEQGQSREFLTTHPETGRLVRGTVSGFGASGEDRRGLVLVFRDTTETLRAHAELDRLMGRLIDRTRRPVMAVGAILDVMDGGQPDTALTARLVAALRSEIASLTTELDAAARAHAGMTDMHWPIRPTRLPDVVPRDIRIASGADTSVLCDGFFVALVLRRLRDLLRRGDRREIRLDVVRGAQADLVLTWAGEALSHSALDPELETALHPAYGSYTLRDGLEAHRTDIWVQERSRIVFPLPTAQARDDRGPRRRSGFAGLPSTGIHADLALDETTFVVFDTETTGLDPERDEVVQIAALRIVRGRIMRDEAFDRFVHPGRPIPPAATAVHRITDDMVSGAPDWPAVAALFKDFAEDAVLVAHNAPFDMAFLDRLARSGGPRLSNPVLCTARLSRALAPHTGQHTLDALAERYGVRIDPGLRHTALGDADTTAVVLLKMLPLLKARGVTTVSEAVALQSE